MFKDLMIYIIENESQGKDILNTIFLWVEWKK
jgi:hypothetical protein